MNESLYVSTDAEGVEHSAAGKIIWSLPPESNPTVAEAGHSLSLRRPAALLEVLEEEIYRAEPTTEVEPDQDGVASVSSARLIERTSWSSESATLFALDCAERALRDAPDATLPDGTQLQEVIADARKMLGGTASDASHRLGYFASLSALRRLRRDRVEVADLSLAHMVEDEAKDLDALDDPAYTAIIPVADAVLAAIEALRHHVLPRFYTTLSDIAEDNEEARSLDREHPEHAPLPAQPTPFGPIMFGSGSSVLRFAPSGSSAREAARHARMAALSRQGPEAEINERAWQADRLAELLSNH